MEDPDRDSITGTLDIIGDRWTVLILRNAFRGIRRFDELHHDLGIARNVLADRLARLVEHGILVKVPYQARPLRHEYHLTDKGRDLSPALVALMHWGDKHLHPEGAPTVLVHKACGHPLDLELVCWHCDEVITPTQISSRPGTRRRRRKETA